MNRYGWVLCGLLLAAPAVLPAWAQETSAQALAQARQAYDRGEYAVAADLYRVLADRGVDSAALFYNLGNAEYKQGHLGKALAYYRRAAVRAPWDADIRYNLAFVRGQVPHPPSASGPIANWVRDILTRYTGRQLALTALTAYLFLMVAVGWLIRARGQGRLVRWITGSLGVVFLLLAAWASGRIWMERQTLWGVVVTQAEARTGPGQEYPVGFTVPEGREVRIYSRSDGWLAVGLAPEGYKGWMTNAEIMEDR